MKVHIVLWDDQHIVYRMAQWLVDGNGWSIGDAPDNSADVNYYMPYLKFDVKQQPDTLMAAYFTHYEHGTPWKTDQWHLASAYIDAPFVTSPIYCAPEFYLERAQVVTPGVDRDRFRPLDREPNKTPVIGMAGVGQKRKGPGMIVDLFYSGLRIDLRIAGMNWPFPFATVPDEYMAVWYSNLDVYLCTSTIEGIPAPVLEALACDVKVVIPNGVGICDQLPEMEGIRHYRKGDSKDMIRAIKLALDDKPSGGSLRDVTTDYTIAEWCKSNLVAVEALCNAPIFV